MWFRLGLAALLQLRGMRWGRGVRMRQAKRAQMSKAPSTGHGLIASTTEGRKGALGAHGPEAAQPELA